MRIEREALVGGRLAARRPRRGRPPKLSQISLAALSEETFARTWDNPQDAAYDRWREIYGVREG